MSPLPLLLTLTLTLTLGSLGVAEARTFPTEVAKLLALKAELETRGLGYLLDSWTCPPEGECDPCGPTAGNGDSWGAWHYIACRQVPPGERAAAALRQAAVEADPVYAYSTPPSGGGGSSGSGPGQRRLQASGAPPGEGEPSNVWGLVTNIHLSDLAIEGTLDSMQGVLCPFRHLRELDMDGGRLRGKALRHSSLCHTHRLPRALKPVRVTLSRAIKPVRVTLSSFISSQQRPRGYDPMNMSSEIYLLSSIGGIRPHDSRRGCVFKMNNKTNRNIQSGRRRSVRCVSRRGTLRRGPIPGWLGTCFPHLLELDLSHNQLSGSIPGGIWSGLANLEQAKLEDNRLTVGGLNNKFNSVDP
jgi:hypothetical protein